MSDFFYESLREVMEAYTAESVDAQQKELVVGTYDQICRLSKTAKEDGLLEFEKLKDILDFGALQAQVCGLMELVTNGVDPEMVQEIGQYRYVTDALSTVDRLCYLLYFRGLLLTQAGSSVMLLEEILLTMLPQDIRAIIAARNAAYEAAHKLDEEGRWRQAVDLACEMQPNQRALEEDLAVRTCVETIRQFSDEELQEMLKETTIADIEVMLTGMPADVKRKIFGGMNKKTGILVAEDIQFMGRMKPEHVHHACETILRNGKCLYH